MKYLVIDAANLKILFSIIVDGKSYTNSYSNSRENFDKLTTLLLEFLEKNKIQLNQIEKIFINQGPGKFSSIRTSLSIAKAISLTKNISLYGFNSNDINNGNYLKLIDLEKKGFLTKDLINPIYSS